MPKFFVFILLAVGALIVITESTFVVRETEQKMVLTLGKIHRVIEEPGLAFKIPFYQQVLAFEKRILETDSAPEGMQTQDKKRVVVDSFTRWRIADAEQFYKAVRSEDRARRRINTLVNASIKRVVARETLVDLVSGNRDAMMQEIQGEVGLEASKLGVEIVDVRIKRADLPGPNSQAIFDRMRTERVKEATGIRAEGREEAQKITADAEKQRTILLAEAERDAQKLRGEGDAEAIRVTANAFKRNPDFYAFQRQLETYEKSLATGDTTLVLDPSSPVLRLFGEK